MYQQQRMIIISIVSVVHELASYSVNNPQKSHKWKGYR
jgi:hypothetical protein